MKVLPEMENSHKDISNVTEAKYSQNLEPKTHSVKSGSPFSTWNSKYVNSRSKFRLSNDLVKYDNVIVTITQYISNHGYIYI